MNNEKRLYRDTENQKIAGVCAGLADYFEIDVTIIRLAFVLLAFLAGSTIWVYLIMALVVPKEEF